MEAVKTYLLIGNVAMTARMLDIPDVTLRSWRREDWWKDAVNEIRHTGKVELTAKLKTAKTNDDIARIIRDLNGVRKL